MTSRECEIHIYFQKITLSKRVKVSRIFHLDVKDNFCNSFLLDYLLPLTSQVTLESSASHSHSIGNQSRLISLFVAHGVSQRIFMTVTKCPRKTNQERRVSLDHAWVQRSLSMALAPLLLGLCTERQNTTVEGLWQSDSPHLNSRQRLRWSPGHNKAGNGPEEHTSTS